MNFHSKYDQDENNYENEFKRANVSHNAYSKLSHAKEQSKSITKIENNV